jgi:hypothetical protein
MKQNKSAIATTQQLNSSGRHYCEILLENCYKRKVLQLKPKYHCRSGMTHSKPFQFAKQKPFIARRPFMMFGVCRPDADPKDEDDQPESPEWFIRTLDGALLGENMDGEHAAGCISEGDRLGMLVNLDDGSLTFFLNGIQHGEGYPKGSINPPVAFGCHMMYSQDQIRLLPNSNVPPLC